MIDCVGKCCDEVPAVVVTSSRSKRRRERNHVHQAIKALRRRVSHIDHTGNWLGSSGRCRDPNPNSGNSRTLLILPIFRLKGKVWTQLHKQGLCGRWEQRKALSLSDVPERELLTSRLDNRLPESRCSFPRPPSLLCSLQRVTCFAFISVFPDVVHSPGTEQKVSGSNSECQKCGAVLLEGGFKSSTTYKTMIYRCQTCKWALRHVLVGWLGVGVSSTYYILSTMKQRSHTLSMVLPLMSSM